MNHERRSMGRSLLNLGVNAGRFAWKVARRHPWTSHRIIDLETKSQRVQKQIKSKAQQFEQRFTEWIHKIEEEARRSLPSSTGPTLHESYQILDLPYGTPYSQVRQRWKSEMIRCHPDRFTQDNDAHHEAEIRARQLNRAYQVIKQYQHQ